MSENGFYGFLTALLVGAVLGLARHVDWPTIPPVGVTALLFVALAAIGAGLVAIHWAAERELSLPVAHPIC